MRYVIAVAALLSSAGAGSAEAQAVSRAPAGPPRPVAVARMPSAAPAASGQPAPSGERPANGERPAAGRDSVAVRPVLVEAGYNPAFFTNYGYAPAAGTIMYVQQPIPPAPMDVPGMAPRPAMAWIPGFYQWNGGSFFWTPGRWVDIPPPATRWVAGRWATSSLGNYWVPGYWAIGN